MQRIIISSAIVLMMGAAAIGGTGAFFGDAERSTGNTFAAGDIDITIDNESYYNGAVSESTTWIEPVDLEDGVHFFLNFLDLKPDDWGEDTISIHVGSNDAWACMDMTLTSDDDNSSTEPELDDGDVEDVPEDIWDGELGNNIAFWWWADDGDNVYEVGENSLQNGVGTVSQFFGEDKKFSIALADSNGNVWGGDEPLPGNGVRYIGKAWCFGEMVPTPLAQDNLGNEGNNGPLDRGTGFTCDGESLDNITQTDGLTIDVVFSAVQARHNANFVCEEGDDGGFGCSEKVDVMLVIDRSGSVLEDIDTLKAAGKAFVDALAPSAEGVHIGLTSFGTTASLDVHLTDDGDAVKTAIDALVASGSTNLAGGISLADLELDNPGDGHDRDDVDSPDIIVIITDGVPNIGGPGTAEATAAKADGIEIFAVGVDISVAAANHMRDNIVSPLADDHYFDAADFGDLSTVLEGIAECKLD